MSIPPIDTDLKSWVEIFSWLAAIIGGIIAAICGLYELRQNRYWRQTEAAKKLIDDIDADQLAKNAMQMLDWEDAEYKVDNQSFKVNEKELLYALRIQNPPPNENEKLEFNFMEKFIRDCFDRLFYHIALFELSIQRKLIQFADIKFPIDYYVGKMSKNRIVFGLFALAYGYEKVVAFLERFPEWNQNEKKKSAVTQKVDLDQST